MLMLLTTVCLCVSAAAGHATDGTTLGVNGSNASSSTIPHSHTADEELEASYALQCDSWCRNTPPGTWASIPACSGCDVRMGNVISGSYGSSSSPFSIRVPRCTCADWCRYSPADTWDSVENCCGCGPGTHRRQWLHIALACIVLIIICGLCACAACFCCCNVQTLPGVSRGSFQNCLPQASAPPASEATNAEQGSGATVVTVPANSKLGNNEGLPDFRGFASTFDYNIAMCVSKINAHVHGVESSPPATSASNRCLDQALMLHGFIAGALLALLWVCYFAVLIVGGTWPFALQWIFTCALAQGIVAHYVSTLPCRHRAHWTVVVIGNLINIVIFVWMIWLIDGIMSWHWRIWLVIVTIFAFVAGLATAAAAVLFRPPTQQQPPPAEASV